MTNKQEVSEPGTLAIKFYHQDLEFAEWCRGMVKAHPEAADMYRKMAKRADDRVRSHERIYGKVAA